MLLLFALFYYTNAGSVIGAVRNEFQGDMTLVSAALTKGTWDTKPATIAPSTSYVNVWKASGDSGVQGQIVYSSGRATTIFFFQDEAAGGQIYNISVAPAPWIGGIGEKTSSGSDVTYQYWTHQMCFSSEKCF